MGACGEMVFIHGAPSNARVVGAALLGFTAVVAVLMLAQDVETAREAISGYQRGVMSAPNNVQLQIAQQLQKYDMAIKRVDDGIAVSKSQLVAQSQKLGQATQLAVSLHDQLLRGHHSLLAEAARSRAMKQLRSQLAAKQNMVAAERQRLQSDAMQLAEIEQRARSLLSPKYAPNQKELQAVAKEAQIAPPPPLSFEQLGH